jgi:TPR repeat protein
MVCLARGPHSGTHRASLALRSIPPFFVFRKSKEIWLTWSQTFAYLKGVGVQQDEGQAAKWLKKAANMGDPRAQAALSDLYIKGAGVQWGYVRAYTWAAIAAGQVGGENERLAFLRQRMTRSESADANRRIQTWFHAQKVR